MLAIGNVELVVLESGSFSFRVEVEQPRIDPLSKKEYDHCILEISPNEQELYVLVVKGDYERLYGALLQHPQLRPCSQRFLNWVSLVLLLGVRWLSGR